MPLQGLVIGEAVLSDAAPLAVCMGEKAVSVAKPVGLVC